MIQKRKAGLRYTLSGRMLAVQYLLKEILLLNFEALEISHYYCHVFNFSSFYFQLTLKIFLFLGIKKNF